MQKLTMVMKMERKLLGGGVIDFDTCGLRLYGTLCGALNTCHHGYPGRCSGLGYFALASSKSKVEKKNKHYEIPPI